MTLDNLIVKSKQGDAEAFSELIYEYEKNILNFTYRMLGSHADAEDVTQEVFLKAYRGIKGFDERASFKTWLYKIAANTAYDALRKKKSRKADMHISLYAEGDDGEYELAIEGDGDSPYESLQKKEMQKALNEAVLKLSHEHRAVILLRDMQNLSYEEIASITNQSVGTVKSRISRARHILRKNLEKNKELFYF